MWVWITIPPTLPPDSILSWWKHMGCKAYRKATELVIMADAGGSNSNRSRLWKVGVQRLAD